MKKIIRQKASALRETYGIPAESFVFLFVGRLDRDKGLDELVQAFQSLAGEGFDVHLLLVGAEEPGGKPLDAELRERMNRCDRIHRSDGWQDDVRPWYVAADALVLPSYREGFPNVVLEAGAMGLPTIVTDVNGAREIIREGENGVIVPIGDEKALHQAMKRFVTDATAVQQMASAARKLIADRFDQHYVRQCLKDYYHEILA